MSSELDDLFGDDVVNKNVDNAVEGRTFEATPPGDDDLFGDEQTAEDENHSQLIAPNDDESLEEIVTRVEVPNLRQPGNDTGSIYLAKLPSFLDINTIPFDPDQLLAEIQQSTAAMADNDERIIKKRSLVNTLRWKHSVSPDGLDIHTSNARFVKWSDNTMSLQIGEELFDVPMKDMKRDHSYLTLMHAEEGLLRSMQRFSTSMTFQPFGLSSKSHAELKADIARRAISSKGRTVKLHTEMIDPADFQKQAIKADNEKQKARRRLDNQKARMTSQSHGARDRTQLTARYLDDSDDELNDVRQSYADDDDDGFVEDDEEQDAAGRERLQALKSAGAEDYRNRKKTKSRHDSADESSDESIVYDNDALDDSEEEAVMTPKESNSPEKEDSMPRARKLKRRIADSDEEESDT